MTDSVKFFEESVIVVIYTSSEKIFAPLTYSF